jgi:hypothetical protein
MHKHFLILGPEDSDHLPLFWSREHGQWMDRDGATLYTEAEVFSFPPRELPSGARGIIDIENAHHYTPPPGRVGLGI